MGQCISRELNLERQTEKEKEQFFKEYKKRFHVSPAHSQRQRAYAHPKLQAAQEEQVIQVPPEPEFVEVVMPEMEEVKLEEEVVVEARSPSPPPPVIVVESKPPPEPRQLNQPSYHLIRSIGPISNIAQQRKSFRQASASRNKGEEGEDELNQSFTYKRDSAVQGRKSKISATPGQAIIQNLLNEYLPIGTGKPRDSQRLSASQDGSSLYNSDFISPNPRGRFKQSQFNGNHSLLNSEAGPQNRNVDDLVERYAGGQRDNVRDNESREMRKLLKEEEEIKETVREMSQDNLSNKETSFPSPRHQEDRPKVQYYKQQSEEFLEEDSEFMQNRLKGETLDDYLKRSTVFKREQS